MYLYLYFLQISHCQCCYKQYWEHQRGLQPAVDLLGMSCWRCCLQLRIARLHSGYFLQKDCLQLEVVADYFQTSHCCLVGFLLQIGHYYCPAADYFQKLPGAGRFQSLLAAGLQKGLRHQHWCLADFQRARLYSAEPADRQKGLALVVGCCQKDLDFVDCYSQTVHHCQLAPGYSRIMPEEAESQVVRRHLVAARLQRHLHYSGYQIRLQYFGAGSYFQRVLHCQAYLHQRVRLARCYSELQSC